MPNWEEWKIIIRLSRYKINSKININLTNSLDTFIGIGDISCVLTVVTRTDLKVIEVPSFAFNSDLRELRLHVLLEDLVQTDKCKTYIVSREFV
jgi:hypothetical protein